MLNEVSHNKILIIHKVFPILRVLMNSGSPKEMISLAQNTQILFQIDVSEFKISAVWRKRADSKFSSIFCHGFVMVPPRET